MYILILTEQEKEESGNIDRDAIAHRLKQDVVSIFVSIIMDIQCFNLRMPHY